MEQSCVTQRVRAPIRASGVRSAEQTALSRTCSRLQQSTPHSELLKTSAPPVSDSCIIPNMRTNLASRLPPEAQHGVGSPVACMEVTVGVCGNSTVSVCGNKMLVEMMSLCDSVLADKKLSDT